MNRHSLTTLARTATFALTLAVLAACGTQAQEHGAIPPAQVSVAPVVAKEAEFRLPPNGARVAGDTPELFFCRDLEGYGWCVRKGDYLNIGIGRRDSRDFGTHVKDFIAFVEANQGLPRGADPKWRGHAYLATGICNRRTIDNGMLLVGDAAGLAYPESGEGIRPRYPSMEKASGVSGSVGGGGSWTVRWEIMAVRPLYRSGCRGIFCPAKRRPAEGATSLILASSGTAFAVPETASSNVSQAATPDRSAAWSDVVRARSLSQRQLSVISPSGTKTWYNRCARPS